MQAFDKLSELRQRVRGLVVREVAVEFVDIKIVPQAFKRYVGINVAINYSLNHGDILVAPASLVEAKGPVHLRYVNDRS
jgi:hypothetical protein